MSVSGDGLRVPGVGASLVAAALGVGIELSSRSPMRRIHGKSIFDVANDDETCARGKDVCSHVGAMLYEFH